MVNYHPLFDSDPEPWNKMAEDRRTCPVARIEEPDVQYYQVCTYELVKQVHRDHGTFLNAPGVALQGAVPDEEQVLTFTDPPRLAAVGSSF